VIQDRKGDNSTGSPQVDAVLATNRVGFLQLELMIEVRGDFKKKGASSES
jgi:hypothetical protein